MQDLNPPDLMANDAWHCGRALAAATGRMKCLRRLRPIWRAGSGAVLTISVFFLPPVLAQTSPQPTPFSTDEERCIIPAAQFHQVNAHVLRAILRVETSLRPATVTRNTNGTVDVGMGGMNSSNFRELAKHGIAPEHLLDACVATYVAAWHL